jgi:hypothetical protein
MAERLYNELTNDSKKINNTSELNIELKEHQKTAIYAMLEFENTGRVVVKDNSNNSRADQSLEIESNYGILADKVGSGKTIMIVGLIVNRLIPNNINKIIHSSKYSMIRRIDDDVTIKTNLIAIPHGLMSQWFDEFKKSNLKVLYISDKKSIAKIESIFIIDDVEVENCIEYYDAVIISCTMYRDYMDKIREYNVKFKWSRIIIDEIMTIKLPSLFHYNCNFIWLITATPNVLNYGNHGKKMYLKEIMNGTPPIVLNNISVKNNDDFVDTSSNLPDINYMTIRCHTPEQYKIINKYVNRGIIDMLNAGNIEEAITKLNCNIRTTDNILDVLTNKLKKDLHNKKLELEYENNIIPSNAVEHNEKIKNIQTSIDKLIIKINDLTERIKTFKESSCPICYDNIENPIITYCCNNSFCIICLTKCKQCPFCRTDIKYNLCTIINDDSDKKIEKKKKLCNKNDILISIIKKKPKGKFIIFSNYDSTFVNIEQLLKENNITHSRITGTNKTINNTITKYKTREIQVLMLNSMNYGSGLNLEMTTDVIIYHELSLDIEIQVIGRAQRPVRNKSLNVYYLLFENEQYNTSIKPNDITVYKDDYNMLYDYIKNTC